MVKKITLDDLKKAVKTAPDEIREGAKIFIVRGLAEYKRIAVQTKPWRVGQSGGGIPRATGNLREFHRTRISGLEGRFGVNDKQVKYAMRIHQGFKGTDRLGRKYDQDGRPWLDYARAKADNAVNKHYEEFMDKIIKHIAT